MPFEHSKKRVVAELGAVLGVLGLLALALVYGGRFLAERAFAHTPRSVDQTIGDAAAKLFDESRVPCGNPQVEAAVNEIVRRLGQAAGPEVGAIHANVNRDEQVNAFALPGGHVYVLSGLLQKIENVDELAGVLAHEIGHVARRHQIRNLGRQIGIGTALSLILGNVDAFTGTLVSGAAQLTALSFSREQEADADAYGVALMAKAGFDPRALGPFLARLPSAGVPAFLQDHPTGEDRRATLAALAAALPPVAPAKSPALADLKAGCMPEHIQ